MSGKLSLSCIQNNLLRQFLISLSNTCATHRFLIDPKYLQLVANDGTDYELSTIHSLLRYLRSRYYRLLCYAPWNSLLC